MWLYPLSNVPKSLPVGPGEFSATRKFDTHTGVDLYCEEGQQVIAVEDGKVVAVEHFTGYEESPWWENTEAVLIEGESGVVLYGEITPSVKMGDVIRRGQLIGTVKRVLKEDKGLPTSMLHLELYLPGTINSEWWVFDRPKNLLDPTEKLKNSTAT